MKKLILACIITFLLSTNLFAYEDNSNAYSEEYIQDTLFDITSDIILESPNYSIKDFFDIYADIFE